MNKLDEKSKVKASKYSGVKVTSTISSLKHSSIYPHLKLSQRDKVCKIDNRYRENGCLTTDEMAFIWKLYWNFVINDFRYPKSLR